MHERFPFNQVYMFDGVGLNSQEDPEPVKKEIQVKLKPKYGSNGSQ